MGYPLDLFTRKDMEPEFMCVICQDVLRDPVVMHPCEHVFCRVCIDKWLIESPTCPICRKCTLIYKIPERAFLKLLDRLQLQCQFLGCKVVVALGDLKGHEKKCEFKTATNQAPEEEGAVGGRASETAAAVAEEPVSGPSWQVFPGGRGASSGARERQPTEDRTSRLQRLHERRTEFYRQMNDARTFAALWRRRSSLQVNADLATPSSSASSNNGNGQVQLDPPFNVAVADTRSPYRLVVYDLHGNELFSSRVDNQPNQQHEEPASPPGSPGQRRHLPAIQIPLSGPEPAMRAAAVGGGPMPIHPRPRASSTTRMPVLLSASATEHNEPAPFPTLSLPTYLQRLGLREIRMPVSPVVHPQEPQPPTSWTADSGEAETSSHQSPAPPPRTNAEPSPGEEAEAVALLGSLRVRVPTAEDIIRGRGRGRAWLRRRGVEVAFQGEESDSD